MPLTLVIPELLWPEPEDRDTQDALICPALTTLLARATCRHRPAVSYEAALCDTAGLADGAPYAALRRMGEADAQRVAHNGQAQLCIDPVHLRFLQERLVLADPSQLALSDEETRSIIDDFNRNLATFGRFHSGTAGRWYLEPNDPALATEHHLPPLSAVAGRSVERLLPSTSEARNQRRLHNEAQMLLHAHPVNRAREETGKMTINALWLWGGGTLPAPRDEAPALELPFDSVWSTDPLARGLARAAGVPTAPQPVDATTWLTNTAPDAHSLVVLDELASAVHYESGEAYRAALSRLDTDWFAPLLAALRRGTLHGELTLIAPTVYGLIEWRLGRLASWAFWRRAKPLANLAREFAAHHDTPPKTP